MDPSAATAMDPSTAIDAAATHLVIRTVWCQVSAYELHLKRRIWHQKNPTERLIYWSMSARAMALEYLE